MSETNEAIGTGVKPAGQNPGVILFLRNIFKPGNRAILITMVFLCVFGVVALLWLTNGRKTPVPTQASTLAAPRVDFKAGATANPQYQQTFYQDQAGNAKSAEESGKSFAPGFLGDKEAGQKVADGKQSGTKETEGYRSGGGVLPPQSEQTSGDRGVQAINREMVALMGSWSAPSLRTVTNEALPKAPTTASATSVTAQKADVRPKVPTDKPDIGIGDLYFAVMDLNANSDQPGPIMATIQDGPLAGARLVGSFKQENEKLVLEFTTVSMKDKTSQTISAVAVDPAVNQAAIATSVDHHYLERFGLLLGGSFLQGFGQAVMTAGTTQVSGLGTAYSTISPRGLSDDALAALGQVGQSIGTVAQANVSAIKPSVDVAAGTGVGILFLKPVTVTAK